MYKLHLILKYLRRRRIAWVSLVAVMLCTTMVLVVISVMGGWLDMFENSARGLTGDVVVKTGSLSGFPYYEQMIDGIQRDPDVVAAAPALFTYGLVNIANRKTDAVQVIGYPMDEIGKVNQFPQSLYRQHQKYLDEHQPPPEHKTFDLHEVTRIEVDELPEGVRVDANGRVVTDDPALSEKFHFGGVRGGLGFLSFQGHMSDEERQKLTALSASKSWREAVNRLASQSNWPGMICGSGVLDIRKDASGKIEGREDWKYTLWAKLTVLGIGADQSTDVQNKAERQYWIVDDSRTGMWQYDTKTVYVPFDVLQKDLGMNAKEIFVPVTVFSADSPSPQHVLGTAGADGKYSLYQGRSLQPLQTVELKSGQQLGFRKAEGGQWVAVAGEQTFDLAGNTPDADWRYQKPAVEPARATEIHVRLKNGADLDAVEVARKRIEQVVQGVFAAHRAELLASDEPRVESWRQASELYISAIEKEKLLVVILFGIISIVAIFLIFCIFYMIVAEKTKDIGIIKSVGATSSGVAGIFLGYGLAIGIVGAGLGLLASYLIVHNINQIHTWLGRALHVQIWNPEVYAFDKIPDKMEPATAATIIVIAVLASVLGALVPAIRAARMHPVEALRWE
jgi:ABC-type lipoprotein release transport system permease subunit